MDVIVTLATSGVDVAAAVELGGVLNARIRPAAPFNAVPAGKLVDLEKI